MPNQGSDRDRQGTISSKSPKVSVIIPSYNCDRYLPEAIVSVLHQSYQNYEIIVIDDGSTDNTSAAIEPYLAKIRYIYQDNQGTAIARNHGIDLATGELIAFLDADDIFLPHKLKEQVAIFKQNPDLGIVNSGYRIIKENGEVVMDIERWQEIPDLTPEVWLIHKPILPSAMMFRREWFEQVGGFQQQFFPCEDIELTLRMAIKGCKSAWLTKVTVCYRQRDRSATSLNSSQVLLHNRSAEAMQDYFFTQKELPESIRQLEAKSRFYFYTWLAWLCYQTDLLPQMAQYLAKSASHTPLSSAEIIVNWINTFDSCAKVYACEFDAYKLGNLDKWQQAIASLQASSTIPTFPLPKVSVIIPSYNCDRYLPEAIDSVLRQTYKNYEIIVIDDGSTDNTSAAIKPYLAKIRYVYQDNQGVSAARNCGLALAEGELIAFLDADDLFLPDKLQQQVAVFEQHPDLAIVNSGYHVIQEDGEVVMDVERWHEIPDLTPEVWLLHKPVLPSVMMFRKEWLERVGGFDPRFSSSEDVEVVLRMVIQGCKAAWLTQITTCYRRHNHSVTWKKTLRQVENSELMQDYFFSRQDLPASLRQLEYRSRFYFYSWLAWLCYQGGLLSQMVDYLAKSRNYAPFPSAEIIVNWINTFESCARMYACKFDAYELGNLKQWQQAIDSLKALPIFNSYAQEIAKLQQLLTANPDPSEIELYAQVYLELGEKMRAQRDLDRAIICLRQAVELVPDRADYHHSLGMALEERYDLNSALAAYQRAIRLNPDEPTFRHSCDLLLKQQQDWQEVLDYCQKMQKVKGNQPKILMIFPFPPYPLQQGGAAIRMFEQIKYFGRRYHLTVVCFIFQEADRVLRSQLEQYCHRAFLLKPGKPMSPYTKERHQQLYFLQTWNMWKTLEQLSLIDFDLVSFEFIFSTVYYPLFSGRLTVLNEHNIESRLLQSCTQLGDRELISNLSRDVDAVKPFVNAEREAKLLREYENQTWKKFALRTVVSQIDKLELDRLCVTGKTLIVKNGIDTQAILPVDNCNAKKILFMGTMSYFPNIDAVFYFVSEILPLVRQYSDSRFCIAGREPPEKILNLSQSDPSIEIIADPQDMSQVACQCQMTVVPLRAGSGTRIKILHSLAMGIPVVSTSLGAEGLDVVSGEHLLIGDRPQEFAQAILAIQANANLRTKLSTNGRKLVETKYDWEHIFAQYENWVEKNL
ncbi:glycosyltransferase [Waterburya agarophytonicola K14]|uniref:Glycosyltransferase n=1 Tax=Waterburya agarophytonicola KI4 TaxID=2874699 RepID=A0A964BPU0_9CYAN|nr:glycosyltransferase [Waterburya agarophytonicola]MCC0176632.1 glycosyltransferase [Waterburya agarophytonicola KI4]